MTTPTAGYGPLLVATMVKTASSPALMVEPSGVLLIATSEQVTVISAPLVLLAVLPGSSLVVVAVALFGIGPQSAVVTVRLKVMVAESLTSRVPTVTVSTPALMTYGRLAGLSRDGPGAGRQGVGDDHVLGRVRPGIGDHDGERRGAARIDGAGIRRLLEGDQRAEHVDRGGVSIRLRVRGGRELVGGLDLGRVLEGAAVQREWLSVTA